ncbi:MAG: pyridoxamine 5'-phosphate oxidase family protein [Candidatus Latescibacterota bacterium]|jgi:hypothetical protein
MKSNPPTERARVKRLPERGAYDKETINAILDEGRVCHVGFAVNGRPFVIPMAYARSGNRLILHGSGGSRLMKLLKEGVEVCVEVTHLDGLVLARSAFHHSMNYRSVVVFGKATAIEDDDSKIVALEQFFERIIPGRWADSRKPNRKELAQTALVELSLDQASAKIRSGPPADDEEDYNLSTWAGVLPFEVNAGPAEDDPKLARGIEKPDYVLSLARKRGT